MGTVRLSKILALVIAAAMSACNGVTPLVYRAAEEACATSGGLESVNVGGGRGQLFAAYCKNGNKVEGRVNQ